MGLFVEESEYRLTTPLPKVVGPTVKLLACSAVQWNCAVFVCCAGGAVQLRYSTDESCWHIVQPRKLAQHEEWEFFRFEISQMLEQPKKLRYEVLHETKVARQGTINVPGSGQEWNIVAYSCYDQRRDVGERLWEHIADKNVSGERPVHVVLGGGDQLYNDNVWNEPRMTRWLELEQHERLSIQPSEEDLQEIRAFYLASYLRHLNFHAAAEFLRGIPQLNTWDDHDIFDGWGSYPAQLQDCPMFRAVFREAQTFYRLFQLMTTPELAESDGYVVTKGPHGADPSAYHYVGQLGPSVGIALPDTRAQRTREHIISSDAYVQIAAQISLLPASVKHLIFLSAVPVVYPKLAVLEGLLKRFEGDTVAGLLAKTGLYDKVMNAFDQPDLLDDVTDHWSSSAHNGEKQKLLLLLRDLAAERALRVTLLSGDVHLCTFGWAASKAGPPPIADPGFIPQIVTSAIGNKPPEDLVVSYLESQVKPKRQVAPGMTETMAELFAERRFVGSRVFTNRMNVCELSAVADGQGNKALAFNLVVLGGDAQQGKEIAGEVGAKIPPLLPLADAKKAAAEYLATFELAMTPKRCSCLCC